MIAAMDRCFQGRRPKVLVLWRYHLRCLSAWCGEPHIAGSAPCRFLSAASGVPCWAGPPMWRRICRPLVARSAWWAWWGVDAAGQEIRALLDKQGIAGDWLVEDASRPTTEKTRLVAPQQMLRLDWGNAPAARRGIRAGGGECRLRLIAASRWRDRPRITTKASVRPKCWSRYFAGLRTWSVRWWWIQRRAILRIT